jgi:hypothetical protein
MYRFFTVVALAIFVASAAGATETVSTDGAWWNDLTINQKVPVMFGATSAYSTGYSAGQVDQILDTAAQVVDAMNSLHWSTAQRAKFNDAWTVAIKNHTPISALPDFSGKPIKAYIDGMDYFYSNHPEASQLNFSFALKCIQNKPAMTCDDVARSVPR